MRDSRLKGPRASPVGPPRMLRSWSTVPSLCLEVLICCLYIIFRVVMSSCLRGIEKLHVLYLFRGRSPDFFHQNKLLNHDYFHICFYLMTITPKVCIVIYYLVICRINIDHSTISVVCFNFYST